VSPLIFINASASPKSEVIGTRVTNKISDLEKRARTTGKATKQPMIRNCRKVKTPKKILSSNSLSKGTWNVRTKLSPFL